MECYKIIVFLLVFLLYFIEEYSFFTEFRVRSLVLLFIGCVILNILVIFSFFSFKINIGIMFVLVGLFRVIVVYIYEICKL